MNGPVPALEIDPFGSSVVAEQIGTIEILRHRVYPLDGTAGGRGVGIEVIVPPGSYPLMRADEVTFWLMEGDLNAGNMKIGDGLFVTGDMRRMLGATCRFPSRFYGPQEWQEFVNSSMVREGDVDQVVRIRESEGN